MNSVKASPYLTSLYLTICPIFSSWSFLLPWLPKGDSALCLFSPISFQNPSLASLFCPLSKYLFHLGYCSWTCSWLYSNSNQHHSFSWNLWSAVIMKSEFPSATSVLSSNVQNISSWLLTVICDPAFTN